MLQRSTRIETPVLGCNDVNGETAAKALFSRLTIQYPRGAATAPAVGAADRSATLFARTPLAARLQRRAASAKLTSSNKTHSEAS